MYINLYKWEDKVLNICFRGNKHVFHLLKLNFKSHKQVNIRYCLVLITFTPYLSRVKVEPKRIIDLTSEFYVIQLFVNVLIFNN